METDAKYVIRTKEIVLIDKLLDDDDLKKEFMNRLNDYFVARDEDIDF